MSNKDAYILAIETSCDDTSASVIFNSKVISNIIATQHVHQLFGGVVPELASRDHEKLLLRVIDKALANSGISLRKINAVAVTAGPGLAGSLMVGVNTAKAISFGLNIPLIAIDHLNAHICSINGGENTVVFPFLCLLVSGGHTRICLVKNWFTINTIGETLDDAVGEAFDKIAKILNLSYPGGPIIDQIAKTGNKEKFKFPTPIVDGFNFSFSGFKTSVLYFVQKELTKNQNFISENINDLCASIQSSLISILLDKFIKAAKTVNIKNLAVVGGVAANSELITCLNELKKQKNFNVIFPDIQYCTDNAAMVGLLAWEKYQQNIFADISLIPYAKQ